MRRRHSIHSRSEESLGEQLMPVTLKDLARALGLSVSTVNAALHDRSDIRLATRKRVLNMAGQMKCRPNPVARSLVTRKTDVLGIIVLTSRAPSSLKWLTESTRFGLVPNSETNG
jgi:DNA-binding LacI/PurR family transcriptional regulator